ncbi:MAG: hypothetical protein E7286_07525 [Lachnospiraceae bacterium]|nr:hypothetical protein [Lachnospiraceae bacterium]
MLKQIIEDHLKEKGISVLEFCEFYKDKPVKLYPEDIYRILRNPSRKKEPSTRVLIGLSMGLGLSIDELKEKISTSMSSHADQTNTYISDNVIFGPFYEINQILTSQNKDSLDPNKVGIAFVKADMENFDENIKGHEWTPTQCAELIKHYPDCSIIAYDSIQNQIIGDFSFIPIENEHAAEIYTFDESSLDIRNDIKIYSREIRDIFVLNFHLNATYNANVYKRLLLDRFIKTIYDQAQEGIFFRSLFVYAFSPEDYNYFSFLGFEEIQQNLEHVNSSKYQKLLKAHDICSLNFSSETYRLLQEYYAENVQDRNLQ